MGAGQPRRRSHAEAIATRSGLTWTPSSLASALSRTLARARPDSLAQARAASAYVQQINATTSLAVVSSAAGAVPTQRALTTRDSDSDVVASARNARQFCPGNSKLPTMHGARRGREANVAPSAAVAAGRRCNRPALGEYIICCGLSWAPSGSHLFSGPARPACTSRGTFAAAACQIHT